MTGLKLIRRRFNYTVSSFADRIGVSRQILTEWEKGNKAIPNKRKKQISEIFGISEDFIGEITEEQKEIILNKAMFKYEYKDEVVYSFIPDLYNQYEKDGIFNAYFMTEDVISEAERYLEAEKRYKKNLQNLQEIFHGKNYSSKSDKTMALNRDSELFEMFLTIYNTIWEMETSHKMDYYVAFKNILRATALAYSDGDKLILEFIEEGLKREEKEIDFTKNYDEDVQLLKGEIENVLAKSKKETEHVEELLIKSNDKEDESWKKEWEKKSLAEKIETVEKAWKSRVKEDKLQVCYYVNEKK